MDYYRHLNHRTSAAKLKDYRQTLKIKVPKFILLEVGYIGYLCFPVRLFLSAHLSAVRCTN